MVAYKILRFFKERGRPSKEVGRLTGLSLEEAQAHCQDPESSSWTCTAPDKKAITDEHGEWFDGYTLEDRP